MISYHSNWLPSAATFLSILSSFAPGLAQAQDAVTFRAGLSVQNDDNFFRAAAAQVSERIMTESVGVHVAIPYSLQRFELDVGLNNNQHNTFNNFDYVGRNYSAAWHWSYTPQLHGNITTARTETLNAASDALNPALRNRNTTTSHGFDAVYEWGGPWQLSAGAAQSTSINEQALIGQANNNANTYNAGIRYALTSGNSISYNLRQARGTSNTDYTLLTHEASGVWVASGNTTLNGRLAYLQGEYASAPQFDYKGFAGGINVNWRATSQITVATGWQRELSSYQTIGSTHTQIDSFTASPTWQISPKTSLSLQYVYAMRHDLGNPTGTPSNRKDNTQSTSIVYNWQPRPFVSLSTSLAHARQSSNVVGQVYTDNLASVAAQFNF